MTNPQKEDDGIKAVLTGIIAMVSVLLWGYLIFSTTGRTDSLRKENDRQWEYYRTLSGSMDDLIKRQDSLESDVRIRVNQVTTTLDNIELSKHAKIYDLEITICKMDKDNNEIDKRTVTMKNVVGINPSIERTATVVDTGLWYDSSVEIPTITDDEEEYACDLKVLSVR